jgi:polyhydroxyalkanoate synthase
MTAGSKGERDSEAVKRLTQVLGEISEKTHGLIKQYLENAEEDDGFRILHPAVVSKAFQEMMTKAWENPAEIVKEQMEYWKNMNELWQRSASRFFLDKPAEPVVTPAPDDRRFKDEAWAENVVFDCIKQCYLLTARHLQSVVSRVDGLDAHTSRKVQFYTRQFIDAMSPANFAATNPEVLKATIDSRGENLLKGMSHMLDDLERNKGRFNVKMTNLEAFRLGENIAAAPGKVIFQNEMMQLLQYTPATETVRQRPLLIVPPWINRYYILDLQPKNSFLKWAVDQGHTVFVVSWVNPDESYSDKTFDEYLLKGPIAALDAIEQATGEKKVNAIGYCIGGTLMGLTLAYMAAKRDSRIASCTFFTSLFDFTDAGEISVFIDEQQIDLMEKHMRSKGYLEGHHLAGAFSMLRDNDLIWSFFVRSYLLGREPMPFDILYWNSDSTNMPAAMHSFYLRNMYLYNRMREPGGVELAGVKVDLRKIKIPLYFLSAREDHIAPWKSTYAGTKLVSGPVRFVLGASGHVAGVMNPPAANKYCYWTNETLPDTPDEWLAAAERHEGSWWADWDRWVAQFAGKSVPARQPGDGALTPVEDAPGSYVKVRYY